MAENAEAKAKAKAAGKAKQPGAAPPDGAPVLGQQQQQQQQPVVAEQVNIGEALAGFQAIIAQQQEQIAQLIEIQMEMGQGGHRGEGHGGDRARQSKVEPPPAFSGAPSSWEEWKRRLGE